MTTESVNAQPSDAQQFEALNHECFCFSLDHEALAGALEAELGQPGLSALVRERCPYVFAAQPVFVAPQPLRQIAQVVRAVEAVVAMPAYRDQVLAEAPAIARTRANVGVSAGIGAGAPRGVFFGYDFHLNHGRLGLIEINTNAGGAMLNALLARAQRACCEAMAGLLLPEGTKDVVPYVLLMAALLLFPQGLSGGRLGGSGGGPLNHWLRLLLVLHGGGSPLLGEHCF